MSALPRSHRSRRPPAPRHILVAASAVVWNGPTRRYDRRRTGADDIKYAATGPIRSTGLGAPVARCRALRVTGPREYTIRGRGSGTPGLLLGHECVRTVSSAHSDARPGPAPEREQPPCPTPPPPPPPTGP